MKQALLIVDVQNDYFADGSMALVGMDQDATNCAELLNHFRKQHRPIFHMQHIATREGATFFVPNTKGCEINESVVPFDGEPVIVKHFPNAFRDTSLNQLLKEDSIEEVVICGAMTHMCIDTTTRAAFDLGYTCHVVSDACATRDLEFNGHLVRAADVQATFMAALQAPFAQIWSAEKYIRAH